MVGSFPPGVELDFAKLVLGSAKFLCSSSYFAFQCIVRVGHGTKREPVHESDRGRSRLRLHQRCALHTSPFRVTSTGLIASGRALARHAGSLVTICHTCRGSYHVMSRVCHSRSVSVDDPAGSAARAGAAAPARQNSGVTTTKQIRGKGLTSSHSHPYHAFNKETC